MQGAERKGRGWCWAFAVTVAVGAALIAAVQIRVDPFGVWGSEIEPGFNNAKSGRVNMSRAFKSYLYAAAKPEVVFLGDSVVSFGMPAEWPGYAPSKVFNYGLDNLQLPEAELVVDQILDVHPPKLIVFGVDLLFLSNSGKPPPPDFSADRLRMTAAHPALGLLSKLRETVFCVSALEKSWTTISRSRRYPKVIDYDDRGYMVAVGESRAVDAATYVKYLRRFVVNRKKSAAHYAGAAARFADLVRRLEKKGIRVQVFVMPYNADVLLAYHAVGKARSLELVKREIAKSVPFWDFAQINAMTTDRGNYYDAAHFRGKMGRAVVARLSGRDGGVPEDFGRWITAGNVKAELAAARRKLRDWRDAHKDLADALARGKKISRAQFVGEVRPLLRFGARPSPGRSGDLPHGRARAGGGKAAAPRRGEEEPDRAE